MNEKYIERDKNFNRNEYNKEYRKEHYTQIVIRPKKEIADIINNYCTDNNINRSQFIINSIIYCIDNNIKL